jgi:hypothetical protein
MRILNVRALELRLYLIAVPCKTVSADFVTLRSLEDSDSYSVFG